MKAEITTIYNIGDRILVREYGGTKVEKAMYDSGNLKDDGNPVYVSRPCVYTITEIQVRYPSGKITYELRSYDETCMFRYKSRSCLEEDIIKKL